MGAETMKAADESAGMPNDEIVTAAVLVIGDEILSGRTKDKNIGFIADHLTAIGIRLREVRIVADDEAEIIAAVDALRTRYTYVFTTGGIGPTHDDITADCIAKAFGVGIDVDQRVLDMMIPYYKASGRELTPGRLRMARIPFGADLVENTVSVAPGFMLGNVITMAGVPNVMQSMLASVTPKLKTGKRMLSSAIDVDHAEGSVADLFRRYQELYPDISMGSYPSQKDGKPVTQLVLRSTDAVRLEEAVAGLRRTLAEAGFS